MVFVIIKLTFTYIVIHLLKWNFIKFPIMFPIVFPIISMAIFTITPIVIYFTTLQSVSFVYHRIVYYNNQILAIYLI